MSLDLTKGVLCTSLVQLKKEMEALKEEMEELKKKITEELKGEVEGLKKKIEEQPKVLPMLPMPYPVYYPYPIVYQWNPVPCYVPYYYPLTQLYTALAYRGDGNVTGTMGYGMYVT